MNYDSLVASVTGISLNDALSELHTGYNEKNRLYAKTFLKHLYENIVYKEDYEVMEDDSYSSRFANKILSNNALDKSICKETAAKFTQKSSDEAIVEEAKASAEALIKIMFENTTLQMNEVEYLSENTEASPARLSHVSSLYNEFNNLNSVTKDNEGNIRKALISEMTDEEKMKLAIKMDVFKNSLSSIGLNVKDKRIAEAVEEEFDKNLF